MEGNKKMRNIHTFTVHIHTQIQTFKFRCIHKGSLNLHSGLDYQYTLTKLNHWMTNYKICFFTCLCIYYAWQIIHLYIKYNISKHIFLDENEIHFGKSVVEYDQQMAPLTMKWYIFSQRTFAKELYEIQKKQKLLFKRISPLSCLFYNNLCSLAKLLSFVLGKLIKVKICKLSQWYTACALVLSFYSSKHFQNLLILPTI